MDLPLLPSCSTRSTAFVAEEEEEEEKKKKGNTQSKMNIKYCQNSTSSGSTFKNIG
jgi:hypothetical protein